MPGGGLPWQVREFGGHKENRMRNYRRGGVARQEGGRIGMALLLGAGAYMWYSQKKGIEAKQEEAVERMGRHGEKAEYGRDFAGPQPAAAMASAPPASPPVARGPEDGEGPAGSAGGPGPSGSIPSGLISLTGDLLGDLGDTLGGLECFFDAFDDTLQAGAAVACWLQGGAASCCVLGDAVSASDDEAAYEDDYEKARGLRINLSDFFDVDDLRIDLRDRLRAFVERQLLQPQRRLLRHKLTFVLSTLLSFLAAYWLGRSPETFHRLYTAQARAVLRPARARLPPAVVLFALRWATYRWQRFHYYLLDFCYFANLLLLAQLWLWPTSVPLIRVCFAFNCGPLLWSIVLFRNSLVFHSLDKITSHFMHWFPALVSWATRWHPSPTLQARAAAALDADPALRAQWEAAGLWELCLLPMLPYLLWAVLYYIKIFVVSSQRIRDRGYHTLFSYITSRRSLYSKARCLAATAEMVVLHSPKRLQPLVYMAVHLLLTATAQTAGWLWWHSHLAHTALLSLVFAVSSYGGATFYFDYFARKYLAGLGLEPRATPRSTPQHGGGATAAAASPTSSVSRPASAVDLAADKQLCDTTYLYEGYQREELPSNFAERFPRYSLIRFVDRDPKLAAVERPAHSVPVVFVHGHLGSHQQMRSLASETGRELRRRLEARDAGAGGGEARADEALHAPFWLDWLAPDFDAQPSALEPALVAQQAEFLAGCMRHLRERHLAGPAAGAPFRLALVAYSMGGHVARLALRRLAADPGSAGLLPEVVLLLQLASPQHVPGFVRPMPLQPAPMHPSWSAAAAAADAAAIPTVTVLAGRSDHMISHSRALAPLLAPGELAVGMEDVPGVWTSASHKRAVACNQLVRRLAPLLVDAALLAVADARDGGGSTAAAGKADQRGNAAVATAVMARAAAGLATNAAAALGLAAPGGNGACGAEVGQEQRQGREELRVDEEFTVARLPPGRSVLNLSWQPGGLHAAGTTGVLLLTSGARPCAQLRVAAPGRQAAAAAAPLPPLLPGRQARHVPRRWDELVEGVDWLANATWLLCVPFSKGGLPSNGSVRVTLTAAQKLGGSNGSGSSGTAEPVLLAQVLPSHPACSPGRELQYPGGPALLLPRGHPALLRLRAPAWPGRDSSPLARLLLGGSPVWSLRVQAVACHGGRLPSAHRQSEEPQEEEAGGVEFLQPAVLAVSSDSSGGDGPAPQHSIPRPTAPAVHWADTVRLLPPGGGGVPLWELGGGAGAPDPLLLLVSDPRCSYAVRCDLLAESKPVYKAILAIMAL
eukprot:scaffold4.g4760.t1